MNAIPFASLPVSLLFGAFLRFPTTQYDFYLFRIERRKKKKRWNITDEYICFFFHASVVRFYPWWPRVHFCVNDNDDTLYKEEYVFRSFRISLSPLANKTVCRRIFSFFKTQHQHKTLIFSIVRLCSVLSIFTSNTHTANIIRSRIWKRRPSRRRWRREWRSKNKAKNKEKKRAKNDNNNNIPTSTVRATCKSTISRFIYYSTHAYGG